MDNNILPILTQCELTLSLHGDRELIHMSSYAPIAPSPMAPPLMAITVSTDSTELTTYISTITFKKLFSWILSGSGSLASLPIENLTSSLVLRIKKKIPAVLSSTR
jgi:hypothetical protein